jgi:hypothetical protein
MAAKTEAEKMRNVRRQASICNAEVARIMAAIKREQDRIGGPLPVGHILIADLRDARHDAGYWNQILNAYNGYI